MSIRTAVLKQTPLRSVHRDIGAEAGFAIVEVVMSTILIILLATGVIMTLQVTTKAASEQRARAQAQTIAQDDQARLRALNVETLDGLSQVTTVPIDGNTYTVTSKGHFVTDTAVTDDCDNASADYVRVSSQVTWPALGSRTPIEIEGVVTPPPSATDATRGAIAVRVLDEDGVGVSDVHLIGNGPEYFSGSTDDNGCALFGKLMTGNYTLDTTGLVAAGMVDSNGTPPGPRTVSVTAFATNSIVLQYSPPGAITLNFKTRIGAGVLFATQSDQIIAAHSSMSAPRSFGTIGTQVSSITASPLFPFSSPYTLYAGSCSADDPNPSGSPTGPGYPATAVVSATKGGSATATIQLPALNLKVYSGRPANPGSLVNGARVRIHDQNCAQAAAPLGYVVRSRTTNASGALAQPGLPWSTYTVCADNSLTAGSPRRQSVSNVDIKNLTSGTALSLYLGTGGGAVSSPGSCP